jgi:hypothetical protein
MASALALNEWEQRSACYSVIELGKDVDTLIRILKHQTDAKLASQAASANAIIVSQDSIREGIHNLSYGIESIAEGLDGLKAAFEFGISEVLWQIEQQREVLKSILEVLMAPLDTEAKELRRRAEDAYANDWVDDALDDFIHSEKKNRYDFAVHMYGHVISVRER